MAGDLSAEKRRLRREVAARLREMAPEVAAKAARAAGDHLMREVAVREARRVALYAALADELSVSPLFAELGDAGKPRLLPRVAAGGRLEFCVVERWEELEPGRYGVLEPGGEAPALELAEGDVVIVPGRAFDARGHRLGRGRGYYDRTFPRGASRGPLLIGAAFELQVVEAVPHGSRDRPMDAIVTDAAVRWVAEAGG